MEELISVGHRALEAYRETGDQVGIGWARSQLVMPLLMTARDEDAEQAGREAVATLEPLGEREELADALHSLGWYLWRRGRSLEAEPVLRRSVEMASRVDSPIVHARATQSLAVCLSQTGRSAEAIQMIEEAYRLAKDVGEFSNLMRCCNNLPSILADLASDYPRAEAVLREGLELAQRAGAKSHMSWMTGSLGDVLFRLGQLEEAERLQREALALAKEVGDEPLRGMRLTALAAAVLFRGRLDESEAIHRESVPVLNENPEPQSQIYIPFVEGYLALLRGMHPEAIERFETMIDQLRDLNVETAPEVFTELIRALIHEGRGREGDGYRDLSESGRSPAARAHAALVEGLLAADPAEARRLLGDGTAELERLGLRIDAAQAMLDLGRAMRRVGEDPRATFERARDILTACDAQPLLVEVEAELG